MAQHIKADGTITEVSPQNGREFTLQEMNRLVGGYLEGAKLTDRLVMYWNEEGLLLQLPPNREATRLLWKHRSEYARQRTIIVGDVIVASLKETGDEEDEEPTNA